MKAKNKGIQKRICRNSANRFRYLLARSREERAFSLIELLAVLAVVSILISLGSQLVGSMHRAGNINKVTLELSLLLEHSRMYAMAKNTYVWVGVAHDNDLNRVTAASVAGLTGASTDISSPDKYVVLQKARTYDNLALSAATQAMDGMALASDVAESEIQSFTIRKEGSNFVFPNVIQFSPSGGAKIKSQDTNRWVQIGFQSALGSHKDIHNEVALQVAVLTGQVRIFRP